MCVFVWLRSQDIVAILEGTVAADVVAQKGAPPSPEIIAAVAEITRSVTARMESIVLGAGNYAGYDFFSNVTVDNRARADCALRLSAVLGLLVHAQSDILVVASQV